MSVRAVRQSAPHLPAETNKISADRRRRAQDNRTGKREEGQHTAMSFLSSLLFQKGIDIIPSLTVHKRKKWRIP